MALLLPGAVLLALDGYGLGSLSLWRDEAYTVDAASRPAGQIFALLRHTDAVNSTYYLLMHAVISVFGTSAVVIRMPSLIAMAGAAVLTGAIGRRLAVLAGLPAPALTGALAGLIFAVLPETTSYAQEARAYGIVTLAAAAATYLLLRSLADSRPRWWVAYGAAIVVTGLFNLLALLLVMAHAVTLLALWLRRAWAARGTAGRVPLAAWLATVAAAAALLVPLALTGYRERAQIGWLGKPGVRTATDLVASFSGSRGLEPLVALLAAGGLLAGVIPAAGRAVPGAGLGAGPGSGPGGGTGLLTPGMVALPWLVLPPATLLLASQVHPVYDARYVIYCLPALALLCAAGLSWLARMASMLPLPAPGRAMAWLPAAVILAALAFLLIGPQRVVRLPSARPDNLREAAAIVAAHERSGDGVFYLPSNMRILSLGYPGPFRRLRDVALARSPAAADNLIGTQVKVAALRRRFTHVGRVWVVTGRGHHRFPVLKTRMERAEMALLGNWHLIRRWYAGLVMLSLFGPR